MSDEVIAPGSLLGADWRVVKFLGAGTFGSVYEVEGTRGPDRCAIKLLRQDLARIPEVHARFLQEALALTGWEHPNIVRMLGTGETDDGRPYSVMELLSGRTLSELMGGGRPLPQDRAVGIASAVLCALQAAHARGIVHRDLKPDNIFLARQQDGRHRVKVLDFGVAKVIGTMRAIAQVTTANGRVLGTPGYMSPEQLRDSASVDARADLWAVGVILYEMLTGKTAFPGATYEEVVLSSVTVNLEASVESMPEHGRWSAFLARATQRDRTARFSSAAEMWKALKLVPESHGGACAPLRKPVPVATASGDDASEYQSGLRNLAELLNGGESQAGSLQTPTAASPGAAPPAPSRRICPNCGRPIQEADAPCPQCGLRSALPRRPLPKGTMLGVGRAAPPPGQPPAASPPPAPSPPGAFGTYAVQEPQRPIAVDQSDRPPPASDQAAVVVLSSPDANAITKRFPITPQPLRIGRGGDSDLSLDADEQVSQRHCHLERADGLVYLVDLGSMNGTFVDDSRVTRQALRPGQMLRAGQTVLKYIDGCGVEDEFLRVVDEIRKRDSLTGLDNSREFSDALATLIRKSSYGGTPLCLVMLSIDSFQQLIDAYGAVTGDSAVVEVAKTLKECAPVEGTLARSGSATFAVLLPGLPRWSAIGFGRRAVDAVAARDLVVAGERVPLTVSAGVALLQEPWTPESLLDAATRELVNAMRTGNAVEPRDLGPMPEKAAQRLLDGPWVIRRALGGEKARAVVAFEIDDEASVLQVLGTSCLRQWFQELVDDVLEQLDASDVVGTWQDRYVLVGFGDKASLGESMRSALGRRSGRDDRAGAVAKAVEQRWCGRGLQQSSRGRVARSLRTASLSSEELVVLRERALDELVVRLLRRAPPRDADRAGLRLPFPLAVTSLLVDTRPTPYARVAALTWGIEVALRFIVAVEIAALRSLSFAASPKAPSPAPAASPDALTGLGALLAPYLQGPLSMGKWLELARQLSIQCVHVHQTEGPVGEVARELMPKPRKPGAALKKLSAAVRRRNQNAHGPSRGEESYGEDESLLRDAFASVLQALRPLDEMRMVSVETIHGFDDDERLMYSLRDHRGPYEHFTIVRECLRARLRPGWAYLLGGSGDAPLLLAPLFGASECAECRRLEVFVADELTLGPRGTAARLRGITSNHVAKAEIPWTPEVEFLFEQSQAARQAAAATRDGSNPLRPSDEPDDEEPEDDS